MDGQMLFLAGLGAMLTFNLGVMFQTMPVPFRSLRRLGPIMMRDSIFALVAIGSVSLVQYLVDSVSDTIRLGLDVAPASTDSAVIISELLAIDGILFALIAGLNATVILAPVAAAVASMLSPVLQIVTSALVLWVILQILIQQLESLWLYFYVLGILLVSIPLRLARSAGLTAMSGAVAFATLLPLAPVFAIQIQSSMFGDSAQQLQSILDEIRSDPRKAFDVTTVISRIGQAVGRATAAIVLADIVFPFAWLFTIGIISKSIASLLGGSSVLDASPFIIGPSRQAGRLA